MCDPSHRKYTLFRLFDDRVARKDSTMELPFWNDPDTGLPHIYDHGVTEEEVQQVMSRPSEDFSGRDHFKNSPWPDPCRQIPVNRVCAG